MQYLYFDLTVESLPECTPAVPIRPTVRRSCGARLAFNRGSSGGIGGEISQQPWAGSATFELWRFVLNLASFTPAFRMRALCARTSIGVLCLFAFFIAGGNAHAQDRAALVALYDATGGANWANNTNWLSTEALSEWHGVQTDGNGRGHARVSLPE